MTFVEIESKRCPCLFLSNNVKNDVNTARFYLPPFPLLVLQSVFGEKEAQHNNDKNLLHLFKHKSQGGDAIMEIIWSRQKSQTSGSTWMGVKL